MINRDLIRDLAARIDGKTKPTGAPGRMDMLAAHLRATVAPRTLSCRQTIFACLGRGAASV
jgi:hypothetical protein